MGCIILSLLLGFLLGKAADGALAIVHPMVVILVDQLIARNDVAHGLMSVSTSFLRKFGEIFINHP